MPSGRSGRGCPSAGCPKETSCWPPSISQCRSKAIRTWLRERGIAHTMPLRADQIRNRLRRGRHGGRPLGFNETVYRRRNVVERCFNRLKQWRGITTRYDKTTQSFEAAITRDSLLMRA
ncbi:transposase [Streptomyces mirabilis]|uniref:transposase n=1 Tax=Streptomyces mirabilis TaxID=68239 RepID=UPI0036902063